MVKIKINGQEHEVQEGMRLLTVLTDKGFKIPSLCFHHALTPAASCKLCIVEVTDRNEPPKTKLSCAIKTKEGMEVVTESAMIYKMRNIAIGNLLKMAPRSERIIAIGEEFNLITGIIPDGCIRCRLCIRVCKEVIGAQALKMVKRKGINYVTPREAGACIGCGTCANLCPTGAIQLVDKGNVRTIMIRDEVIGRHPLERCEMCGRLFATPKFLQHVEQQEHAKEHPDVKEHHQYCSTCAKLYARKRERLTAPVFSKPHGYKPKNEKMPE
jgi:bidirectional [NiFe] hydrogenase diaphorase subunit